MTIYGHGDTTRDFMFKGNTVPGRFAYTWNGWLPGLVKTLPCPPTTKTSEGTHHARWYRSVGETVITIQ